MTKHCRIAQYLLALGSGQYFSGLWYHSAVYYSVGVMTTNKTADLKLAIWLRWDRWSHPRIYRTRNKRRISNKRRVFIKRPGGGLSNVQ